MLVFPPGGALLSESSEPARAGWHRLVLLEGIRLLLSEGGHHDDTTTQLQATLVAIVMKCLSLSNKCNGLTPFQHLPMTARGCQNYSLEY